MVKDTQYYELLGVSPSATPEDLKKGFKDAALKWHPDKNNNSAASVKKMQEILDAYGVLRDPQKRTIYDASGPAAFVRGARARSQGPRPDIDDSDSDIDDNDIDEILDEILREIRKSQRSAAARGRRGNFSFENANLIRQRPSTCLMIFYVLIDMAFSVSAGAAAAAAGAHANGSSVTPRVTQLGALAGLTKSLIVGFAWFVRQFEPHWTLTIPLVLLGSGFGVCLLVTVEMANMVFREIPRALVKAALPTAIFLYPECLNHFGAVSANALALLYCCMPLLCCFAAVPGAGPLLIIPLDALGGVIFAVTAQNLGMPICALKAAATAGAVYGTISSVPPAVGRCLRFCGLMAVLSTVDVEATGRRRFGR